jgi:hypothetical protein
VVAVDEDFPGVGILGVDVDAGEEEDPWRVITLGGFRSNPFDIPRRILRPHQKRDFRVRLRGMVGEVLTGDFRFVAREVKLRKDWQRKSQYQDQDEVAHDEGVQVFGFKNIKLLL